MKKISTYTFKGKIDFNEELILTKTNTKLSKEQTTLINFDPLFDDTYVQKVGKFKVLNIRYTKRKEPDKVVLAEKVFEYLDEKELPQDVDTVERITEEKRLELMQYTGYTSKAAVVAVDNSTGKLIVAEDRKFSDEIMSSLLEVLQGDYEELALLSSEPVLTEKVLTSFLVDERKNLPDPFILVEKVELGDKSIVDKKPKTATIKVDKQYPADDEVLAFVNNCNKVVKCLELEYDGLVDMVVTNTLFLDKIKFLEHLKASPDEDASDSVNFMTQYELQLPAVFDIINQLEKVITSENY